MRVVPLKGRVIVKKCKAEEVLGGIILTQTEPKFEGVVIAVAHDVEIVKEGDHVMYAKYCGSQIIDENHVILDAEEVVALVFNDEA